MGRRLTEELNARSRRHRVLLMLGEFPALRRLDFFESALVFMAGYGFKSFLIAQSLNQIEKAYGANNAILDNCHVRVAFATNDERTAKRVSDALGTAAEMRGMKNYAGHRFRRGSAISWSHARRRRARWLLPERRCSFHQATNSCSCPASIRWRLECLAADRCGPKSGTWRIV
ncbi:MAG: TraM recognition domain-containing protein [Methylocella sp.]